MPLCETVKIVPVDSVLAPGKPEGYQVAVFYPPQDGHLTDSAVPGDGTGGEIKGICFFHFYFQVIPP